MKSTYMLSYRLKSYLTILRYGNLIERKIIIVLGTFLCFSIMSCKKYLTIDDPVTSTNEKNVYNTDANAIAVLTDIYAKLSANPLPSSGLTSVTFYAGLSADEFMLLDSSNNSYVPFYQNDLTSAITNSSAGNFWRSSYPVIFIANAAIEGISASTILDPIVKKQLLGEAKFIRAFYYFYLTNLYSDIPLSVSTDPQINRLLPKSPQQDVMEAIITDLLEAQSLLSPEYLSSTLVSSTNEKLRPTKWAATALLARAYLYNKEWEKAEIQASSIINSSQFTLDTLNGIFLKNSKEAIWQLQPVQSGIRANTQEGILFIPVSGIINSSNPVALSNSLLNSFEQGDERKNKWLYNIMINASPYSFPYKYKIGLENVPVKEYSTVLRLAEQYLIRAEAKAQMGDPTGAVGDLNAIRQRAGLTVYGGSTSQADLLTAILHERQVELFSEWGHRWLDLKRSGTINNLMNTETSLKTNGRITWRSFQQLYPIPFSDILTAPNLKQNQGY